MANVRKLRKAPDSYSEEIWMDLGFPAGASSPRTRCEETNLEIIFLSDCLACFGRTRDPRGWTIGAAV